MRLYPAQRFTALDRTVTERVMLDGGPMHGVRRVREGLRGIAITLLDRAGCYVEVGRSENGMRILRWREAR